MKKIININFQGRVVPIEEAAYDILKQYIESLRRYFANEEGRDEIINDIESRIAELFSEKLKKGASCITDADVNTVIASMGRPEDFDAQDADDTSSRTKYQQQYSNSTSGTATATNFGRGRFYRNADDKIIGGVCSGLANYLGIDPVVMRIIFVLLSGALFWVYILLWIIVPSQSVQSNITKRLFRSTDDKVIAGVCGGLGAYFNIASWIPRLIFALPLVLALVSGTFHSMFWDWDFHFFPRIVSGSLFSTLFVTYIVLWIAVPFATTASEKLEMRGERVDLNSIRDTVKEDLGSLKTRAEAWTTEVKETAANFGDKARQFGQQAGTQAQSFATQAAPVARRAGSGIGYVIGILFKAFFLFIAAMIALALFGALIGLLFGGLAFLPFKNFFLETEGQTTLAWIALIFFLGIPAVALVTWIIRRIMGVRSSNHYLGYIFATLWFVGLVIGVILIASFGRNFRYRSGAEENVTLANPAVSKMYVDVRRSNIQYYTGNWFDSDWDDHFPVYGVNDDTLFLNTVKLSIEKSKDSLFHVVRVKTSCGRSLDAAKSLANKVNFEVAQQDSTLFLDRGFAISNHEKFRNQQVIVIIQVPVGHRIQLDGAVNSYSWFTVRMNRRNGWNINNDDEIIGNGFSLNKGYSLQANEEYIMTPDGIEKTSELDPQELKKGHFKMNIDIDKDHVRINGDIDSKDSSDENDDNENDNRYRYRYKPKDSVQVRISTPVTMLFKETPSAVASEKTVAEVVDVPSSLSGLLSPLLAINAIF
jgi:phage shock protein PspC (stress-responsive transcriptional regulator)